MKAFALRDKSTGMYLPWGKKNKNNSWTEFNTMLYPRLFNTKRCAVNARVAWRAGKWGWWGTNSFDGSSTLEPKYVKERKEAEIEIVEFDLKEKEA